MATLLKLLLQRKMSEGEDVRDHMAQFFETADKLAAMQVEINEKLLTLMLLQSLPASYDVFRRAIESRDTLPDIEILKNKIIEACESIKEDQSPNGAMFVKQPKSGSKYNDKKYPDNNKSASSDREKTRPKYKCNYCKKLGHRAADCYSKKRKEKEKANVVEEAYLVAEIKGKSSEQVNFVGIKDKWCLDSGCTSHLCKDKGMFTSFTQVSSDLNLADGTGTQVRGKGEVKINVSIDGTDKIIKLENALFVPNLKTNLISVSKIVDTDHEVTFRRNQALVKDQQGTVKLKAVRDGDLFYLKPTDNHALATTECSEIDTWHRRLGHLNERDLITMMKNEMAIGLDFNPKSKLSPCETCIEGKLKSFSFEAREQKSSGILDIVHSDYAAPCASRH